MLINHIRFVEEGHLYFNEHGAKVPCVTEILQHFGISDFSMVNPAVLEAACLFGSNVHKTCELYDKDDLESCDPNIEPYLDGWIKYRHDNCISNFDLIEQPLYSKVFGFAGTPDRSANNTAIDIKSGAKTVAHRIQNAFYQILINENFPDLKIKKRVGVYLKPGGYKVDPQNKKIDLNIVKSLASIYQFKRLENLC